MNGLTVLFWDIDGTLLTTARAGVLALEKAGQEVCGVTADLSGLKTAGLTDFEVASLVVHECGAEPTAETLSSFLRTYEGHLPDHLGLRQGSVLPGVTDILDHLDPSSDVISMLLTGNTAAGARAKLEHYGLSGYFAAGVFCADGEDREQIAARALAEATQSVGAEITSEQIWVIGDTPHDIRCGKGIGARTVAVATGTYGVDELREHRPTYVLEQLPDPADFADLLDLKCSTAVDANVR